MTYSKEALLNRPSFEAQSPKNVDHQTEVGLTLTYHGPNNIEPPAGNIERSKLLDIINASAEMLWAEYPDNFYAGQTSPYRFVPTTGTSVTVTAGDGGYTINFFDQNPNNTNGSLKTNALVGQVPIRVTGGPEA